MRIYSVYYVDSQTDGNISFKHQSLSEDNAKIWLEKSALEYIRVAEGEKHIPNAFQTIEEIKTNPNLREANYLVKDDKQKIIYVYEKKQVSTPGLLYGCTQETVTVKLGYYTIVTQDIDVPEPARCACQLSKNEQKSVRPVSSYPFINTLSQIFSGINSNENLSPTSLNYEKVKFTKPLRKTSNF